MPVVAEAEAKAKKPLPTRRVVDPKIIHVRTTENVRKAIFLEPEFYDALLTVTTPDNRAIWLNDKCKDVGKGNLASAVRVAILKAVMNASQSLGDELKVASASQGMEK